MFAQLNTNEVSVDLYMNDQMRLRVSMAVFSDMPLPVAYETWWYKIKRGNDQREVGTLSWLLSKISGVLNNDIERDIKKRYGTEGIIILILINNDNANELKL